MDERTYQWTKRAMDERTFGQSGEMDERTQPLDEEGDG
jgi:hypothetical protein